MGWGCASPGSAQWDGVQGEQLIVHPGSRWAAEHTGGAPRDSFPIPAFLDGVGLYSNLCFGLG